MRDYALPIAGARAWNALPRNVSAESVLLNQTSHLSDMSDVAVKVVAFPVSRVGSIVGGVRLVIAVIRRLQWICACMVLWRTARRYCTVVVFFEALFRASVVAVVSSVDDGGSVQTAEKHEQIWTRDDRVSAEHYWLTIAC